MTQIFIAKEDGFLSDTCQFIKAGTQVTMDPAHAQDFPWLVAAQEFVLQPEHDVLPVVAVSPPVAETKPKAHELEVSRPDYDAATAAIVAGEAARDAALASGQIVDLAPPAATLTGPDGAPGELPAPPAFPAVTPEAPAAPVTPAAPTEVL